MCVLFVMMLYPHMHVYPFHCLSKLGTFYACLLAIQLNRGFDGLVKFFHLVSQILCFF